MTDAEPRPYTAHEAGPLQCRVCGRLSRRPAAPAADVKLRCPRCGARLKLTAGNSVEITWALLIASAILYVPANLLPVMSVYMMGDGEPSTIVGGVIHLLDAGQWPLALIVFVASILVPLLKLISISFILITIQRRSVWRTRERAILYRAVEIVGRWSMVDVFVIAILAGLVQFGGLTQINANAGTFFFAAVVVLTMLAARVLDEHLLWDAHDSTSRRQDAT